MSGLEALREANAELDRLVAERTMALETANAELRATRQEVRDSSERTLNSELKSQSFAR